MDSPAPDDWLTSAIRHLEDNPELYHAARGELAKVGAEGAPEELFALQERFDGIDRTWSVRHAVLSWLPIALAVLIVACIGAPVLLRHLDVWNFMRSLSGMTGVGASRSPLDRLVSGLGPEDRLFVLGDRSQPNDILGAKALWEMHPENPLLYGDYVSRCNPLPGDLIETAQRIDPENGWFHLIAAGELGNEAVEKERRSFDGDPENRPRVFDWKIVDEGKFQQALVLIDQVFAKPRVEYYAGQLLQRRLELLPPERDYLSRVARIVFVANSQAGNIFETVGVSKVLSAHAFFLGESEDAGALKTLIPKAERLCRQLANQEGSIIWQLVAVSHAFSIYKHLAEACEKAGLPDEAARLSDKARLIEAIRKKVSDIESSEADLLPKHGDFLATMAVPAVIPLQIAPPSLEEMKPGRLVDYAWVERAILWFGITICLLLMASMLVVPFMRGRLARELGRRFARVPTMGDWLWILGLGLGLPLLWFFAITRFTSLGCRDLSLGYMMMFQPTVAQWSSLVVLIVVATLLSTRWRFEKRVPWLGRSSRSWVGGFFMVIVVALCIPIAGCMRYEIFSSPRAPLYLVGGVLLVVSLWILFVLCRAVLGARHRAPYRVATAIMLSRVFALSVLVLFAGVLLSRLEERYWLTKDRLLSNSPGGFGMGSKEDEAIRLVQAKLRKALDH